MGSSQSIAALRWQCRRGMLELDIVLFNFLEKKFASLTPEDQQLFIELLARSDQELYDWLIRKETPENRFVSLVKAIYQNATEHF